MKSYYFAYGSNMNSRRVQARAMAYDSVEGAVLPGYRFAFNKKSVKFPGAASANVVANDRSSVEGVLYHLCDEKQILAMDPYEGYPIRYDRKLLNVNTLAGQVAVWVYIANADYIEEGLRPTQWYLRHLLCG